MAGKKGVIPSHIKKKDYVHPQKEHPFIRILHSVVDPRKPSQFFRYPLTSILFMTLIAVMCGADDWAKVAVMSQGMKEWLAQFVDMSEGVPCERTLKGIFNILNPCELEKLCENCLSFIVENDLRTLSTLIGKQ